MSSAYLSTRMVAKGSSRGDGPQVKVGTVRTELSRPYRCHKCGGLRTGDGPHAAHYSEAWCCFKNVQVDCKQDEIGTHGCEVDR